jgi:hypothetical protein
MTFHEFLSCVNQAQIDFPDWRYGQALMNCLWDYNPFMYADITGTDRDCFYLNDRVPAALEYICTYWDGGL